MRLKTNKMATSILLKFLTLKWNISRTIWHVEVSDGSFLCIFHARSFELNFFFDRRFPLMILVSFCRILNGLSDEINLFWRCSSPLINVISFKLRLINFVYFFETPGTYFFSLVPRTCLLNRSPVPAMDL